MVAFWLCWLTYGGIIMSKQLFIFLIVILLSGCTSYQYGDSIRKMTEANNIEQKSPKHFFTASMKHNYISKSPYTKLFKIIHESDNYVYAGYITQWDLFKNKDRYSTVSKYDKKQLIKGFPLYKTFTGYDARKILNDEHKKYDPFVINKDNHGERINQKTSFDYNESYMIIVNSYEYSGNHGPWVKFKMIVKIRKTDISNISSEQIE